MFWRRRWFLLPVLLWGVGGCAPRWVQKAPPSAPLVGLVKLSDAELPGFWDDLDPDSARRAVRAGLEALQKLPKNKRFALGKTEYTRDHMIRSLERFQELFEQNLSSSSLRRILRQEFDVYQSLGSDGERTMIFSAYYEPILEASLEPSLEYKYPLYRRPPDLVEASLEDFDPKWKGEKVVGRVQEGKLLPYFSREEIDREKKLKGQGLEIAWAKDPLEILFLHVQGSGRLRFPGGKASRIRFAATNGLPYRSVGSVLIQSGAIPKEEFDRNRFKEYLKKHPEVRSWLLSLNPRYTFFQLVETPPEEGPVGTLGVPLTPGRSIAIDPKLFPLGALAWVEGILPEVDEQGNMMGTRPFSRFVLAQDTGGAIQGSGRLDLFLGCGTREEAAASYLWHSGKLYFLVQKLSP